MKKIHITLFSVISLLFVTSCDDYLHKDPIGLLTPDNVNTNPTLTSVQYSVKRTLSDACEYFEFAGRLGMG